MNSLMSQFPLEQHQLVLAYDLPVILCTRFRCSSMVIDIHASNMTQPLSKHSRFVSFQI